MLVTFLSATPPAVPAGPSFGMNTQLLAELGAGLLVSRRYCQKLDKESNGLGSRMSPTHGH